MFDGYNGSVLLHRLAVMFSVLCVRRMMESGGVELLWLYLTCFSSS